MQQPGTIIVGVGASAGGLKALRDFFGSLPADTGLAFVVVTHLHPERESHLAELLQHHTPMEVRQVVERVTIDPNHVYVIPPNRNITVTDQHLDTSEFEEPRGHRMPIDDFFRSLASAHQGAVAVILSGGGTDGSVGVKEIKENGGLIMVQDPEDADYDSMPITAIQTGLADVVLPARELAEKLVTYIRQTPQLPGDPQELTEQQAETIQRILAQVHAHTGHDLSQYKRSTILRRIQRRMQLNGLASLEGYLGHMRGDANEAFSMFNDILIGVTNFFRDSASWDTLAEEVIPALFTDKSPGGKIRVWSIGCATGEEAYGLAILLLEHAATLNAHFDLQVFASDLHESSLMHAREGVYPSAIEADVSPERLERFFTRHVNHYKVNRELRDIVLFTNHSILRDPPFSQLDLIVCRNVLIYFQRQIQDYIFDVFHYALDPGGYLFLGNSESAEQADHLFRIVDKTHRIYQAKPWRGDYPHVPALPVNIRRIRRPDLHISPRQVFRQNLPELPPVEEQHRLALEEYGPPSILVNEDYNILHISETAGRYLLQPKGPITSELLKLVRPDLQSELRAALFQAFEKDKVTVSKPVRLQFNGQPRLVVLSVLPRIPQADAKHGKQREKHALVIFLEEEFEEGMEAAGPQEMVEARDEAHDKAIIVQLETELRRLREQLQATIEEYDSSNEEMKATNEELQSINEEYRSATEELETSKEELQSVNEELQTVNNELKTKFEEITRAHSDLENLMGSTEVPTLFLDRDLRIQRYTPVTSQVFNIMPSDRSRPISHLTRQLDYHELEEDAKQVLQTLAVIERDVRGTNSEWFIARLRPYRTVEDKIDGVVITFVDVTQLKQAKDALRQLNETLEERVNQRTRELDEANRKIVLARDQFFILFHANPVPTALTRLDDGLFMDINKAYTDYFGLERDNVIGRTSIELSLPLAGDQRPQMVARLQEKGMIRDLELEVLNAAGEARTVLASMQRVHIDNTEAIISTLFDITVRVRAEQQVRAVASSLTAAEQAERHRISRILHDDLQQNIFAVKMQLTFLSEAVEKNDLETLKLDLDKLDQWLASAIATIRQLSIELSPPILHGEGLAEAVIWLISQMKEQYGQDVTVSTNGLNAAFEEDVRMLVFQCVRELLFNAVKHSGTLEAQVTFEQINGKALITVSDEGKGFESEAMMKDWQAGHGLLRMRDRLFLLGCNLEVKSGPNKGTQVTIEAPIKVIMD